MTVGSPPARIAPTSTSPVFTPMRICTGDPELGRELGERLLHPQRGPHRPLGVVLVRDRRAEQGDDLVADDLVEPAAERGDVGDEPLEAVVDEAFHLLGVGVGREGGEADEVGHQHGDQPALVGRPPGADRTPGRTVPLRPRRAARRTGHAATLPVRRSSVGPVARISGPGFAVQVGPGCRKSKGPGEGTRMERTEHERNGASRARATRAETRPAADRRARRSLDLLPHPAFVVAIGDDEVCHFVYANARYRALFGLDLDGDLGGDLRAVLPPTCSCAHVRAFSRARRESASRSRSKSRCERRPPLARGRGRAAARRRARRVRACSAPRTTSPSTSASRRSSRTARATIRSPSSRTASCCSSSPTSLALRERARDAAPVGLVLLDVDHFKIVNDSLGHEAGDELLAVVAQRVERVLRAGDTLARLGGDELAVVCHDAQVEATSSLVADRVRVGVRPSRSCSRRRGVPRRERRRRGLERRGRHAERAAARRRRRGVRGQGARAAAASSCSTSRCATRTVRRLEIETALRRALVRGEFRVHYQPLVHFERPR